MTGGHSVGSLFLLLLSVSVASADCPPPLSSELLASLPLGDSFRSETMGLVPPVELYRKALAKPDTVIVERDGKLGQAVAVGTVPIEAIWKALNDDDHHDEGGYIPVRESQVISGDAGGSGRKTFQYFKKAGLGRWWVNRLEMNAELYRTTRGRLWELSWQDVLEEYPGEEPPVDIDGSVPKLRTSLGAWLLVPLGGECTLIEYAARGEPGGVIGAFQFLAANRTIRSTVEGMLQIARSHLDEPHAATTFVRPDGSPLDENPGG